MIRVLVEISSGEAARFTVEVRARSIERAVNLATASYPDCRIEVLFPIDPQAFFSLAEAGDARQAEGLITRKTETARDRSSANHAGRRRPVKVTVPEVARNTA